MISGHRVCMAEFSLMTQSGHPPALPEYWCAVIEPTTNTAYKAYHPKHGNLPLDAYMCAERQEPCPNSQMIKTAHAYIA
jgi:hypothetical protein